MLGAVDICGCDRMNSRMEENKTSVLMNRYELGKLLGQGTFAKVHHAKNLQNNTSAAIKILDKEKILKVGMMDQIKREISVLSLVRHPNVVQLYEVMASKTKIYFVMEHVKGGELFGKVAKGRLKEDAARKYFQQLISAVDYCHSRGVYHRDLKPENLLLDENGNLKVSDFGLSALADSKCQDGLLHTTCGTPAYVAPEVIHRKGPKGYDGAKADIWSCGVVLFVLLAGYLPFQDPNLIKMYRKIGKAEFRFPNWFSPEVRRLLSRILDPNPKTRISISMIMENPWFKRGCDRKLLQLQPKTDSVPVEPNGIPDLDPDTVFGPCEELTSTSVILEPRPCNNMNAFDIISGSDGFDLSGLFQEKGQKKEVRFTAKQHASTIISGLEDVAKRFKLKVKKKDGGLLKFEGTEEGRKGVLSFDAEIFEVTQSFHIVEMNKSSGDTLEYQKLVKQDMRPALKDIVWTWQGDQQLEPQAVVPSPTPT